MQQAAQVRTADVSPILSVSRTCDAWSVGQLLAARVLEAGQGGTVLLQVGVDTVQARSRQALVPGRVLSLRVESLGPPVLLRLLDDAVAASGSPPVREARGESQDRRSLVESLADLERLSTAPPAGSDGDVPEAVRAMLCDLMASLPRAQDAGDPQRLRAMVRSSGLFHDANQDRVGGEGAAASSCPEEPVPAAADLKARLAAVADALQQGAGESVGEGAAREAQAALHAALASIQANQALSARASARGQSRWPMELPLTDGGAPHGVALCIGRESPSGLRDGDVPAWVAELRVEPPGQAPLHARVSLDRGAVRAFLTTEDPQLSRRLDARRGELEGSLQAAGLGVAGVDCRRAPLPADDAVTMLHGLVHHDV
jgi:hypothetical protein